MQPSIRSGSSTLPSTSGPFAPSKLVSRASARGVCYPLTTLRSRRTCTPRFKSLVVTARATTSQVGQEFDGLFGKWTLEEADRKEVLSYRAGLTIAAAALLIDSGVALLPPDSSFKEATRSLQNLVAIVGTSGLGLSYALIHIYVTPLKRFLQLLFALGTLGGLYLVSTQEAPVTEYVAQHREAMWLVGPLFASVTGLGIKEGLCYGTAAAAGMTLVTPVLCLGHLSGLMPEGGTRGLLVAFNLLALVFAAGKYSQPIQGDIGDKSIFEVQSLPKEEQEKRWEALKKARIDDGST